VDNKGRHQQKEKYFDIDFPFSLYFKKFGLKSLAIKNLFVPLQPVRHNCAFTYKLST